MSDMDQYTSYFRAGMKVGVGIPMPNAEEFLEWAVIHEIDEDLLTLQLSRDQLPVEVTLHVGQILEIRGGQEDSGYSCRAIIVVEGEAQEILLRLIGEIVSDELREFYRIDAFLPIKYYIPWEQNPDVLKREWISRREQRQLEELEQKEQRWDSTYVADSAGLPQEPHQEENEYDADDSWDTIIPLAANISGGGIRIITHQGFVYGEFVLLEILIPSPVRIVDAVVRVVFATRNYAAGVDQEYYNTAMQFVFIAERDRDAIINHISNVQLKRIRLMREKYLFRSIIDEDELQEDGEPTSVGINWVLVAKRTVYTILFAAIVLMFYTYFNYYIQDRPKNEIEEIFEDGVRKYREKMKR